MQVIKPSFEILTSISDDGFDEIKKISDIARTCYKSEGTGYLSNKRLIQNLIDKGHEAMLEHSQLSVRFICDRGVSHEIVRHRLFSFAQESTRYCNYAKDKFGHELTMIEPVFFEKGSPEYIAWYSTCLTCEQTYMTMIEDGVTPEKARTILPNSLKTEIVVTGNYREWRSFFKLRCAPDAHPQMRELTIPLMKDLSKCIPVIFDDIFDKYCKEKVV